MNRFAIVAAMKRASFLLALMLFGALPLFAQSNEFGVVVGGSRRFLDEGTREPDVEFLDNNFTLSNSAVTLYWGMPVDDETIFRLRAGRIETPVAQEYEVGGVGGFRRDVEGEVQHAGGEIEYRFSEVFGSTGLFAGIGVYRHTGDGIDSRNAFGWNAGVNTIFPITRRYGIVIEGAYHWARGDFKATYLTVGGGLRVAF